MPALPSIERVLRPGLLAGRSLAVAGAVESGIWAGPVSVACAALGASVSAFEPVPGDDDATGTLVQEIAGDGFDVLVVDGGGLFASADRDGDGVAALRACVDGAWLATRAAANHAFIAEDRGGRVVLLAPAPGAGARASAAVAGLENLARTLSIEWSRLGITVAAVAPGDSTSGEEVGAVVAFLASAAGAYYSGCLLDLRGP